MSIYDSLGSIKVRIALNTKCICNHRVPIVLLCADLQSVVLSGAINAYFFLRDHDT
jgi:hypothetical protein